jgi:hypothetical protein
MVKKYVCIPSSFLVINVLIGKDFIAHPVFYEEFVLIKCPDLPVEIHGISGENEKDF